WGPEMPDIIPTGQSFHCQVLRFDAVCLRIHAHWHSARVTKFSVLQSPGSRLRPGMNTLGEHFSAASVSRLLPSLKPLLWQSLSAPALQSGAPFAAPKQAAGPVTIDDGRAMFVRLSPASLARVL